MKKVITLFICIIFIITAFAGCASPLENGSYDDSYEEESVEADLAEDISDVETTTSRKLIKEISLDIETKDYDNYIESLRNTVTANGGYIETSNESNHSEFRSFTATIRIPVEKTESVTEFATNNATVKSRSENVRDVTEQYVDVEARIKVYRAEEESLVQIMKEADNVTDLLSVKQSLADVRAKIESYTAQLKSLENKTAYSTIEITVDEVEREVESEGYWSEIWNNIIKGFENVGKLITVLFAIFLSAIPYFIVIAIIVVAIFVILHYCQKRKKK